MPEGAGLELGVLGKNLFDQVGEVNLALSRQSLGKFEILSFGSPVDTDGRDGNQVVVLLLVVDDGVVVESGEDAGDGQALEVSQVSDGILAFAGADEGGDSVDEVLLAVHRLEFGVRILRQHLIV